ncbi:MAG: 2-keto-4-pentenoate hydratase [Pseudomonadota bacterium]
MLDPAARSTIATAFVEARKAHRLVTEFPAAHPDSFDDAYAVQDLAINLYGSALGGWKVAGVFGDNIEKYGANRHVGPVFKENRWDAKALPAPIRIFDGGFAAVEGEIVAILSKDAPTTGETRKQDWSLDEAKSYIGAICAGVEIATSPYAHVNDDGPVASICDLGCNRGMIVGDEIPNWRDWTLEDWHCETFVDGASVGAKTPNPATGGPLESVRFLLENAATRGIAVPAGAAILTGAITGVHQVTAGQRAKVQFAGVNAIEFSLGG